MQKQRDAGINVEKMIGVTLMVVCLGNGNLHQEGVLVEAIVQQTILSGRET
jgi:hypothetical protein